MKTKRQNIHLSGMAHIECLLLLLGILSLGAECVAAGVSKSGSEGLLVEGYVAKGIFLYDINTNNGHPVRNQPVPNRIHIRFSKEFGEWVFILSDMFGRFTNPPEVLATGSVVSGDMLGGAFNRKYKFTTGARWVTTSLPRQLRLIVLDKVPKFKLVNFESFEKHRVEFVSPKHEVDFRGFSSFACRR